MSSWARPGVKCVCIDPNPRWIEIPWVSVPVWQGKYTVSEVLVCDGEVVIRLEELRNDFDFVISHSPLIYGPAVFGVRRFRPLVEMRDDVALFAHHLDRVGEPA